MDSVGKIGLIIPEIIDQLDYELLSGIFEQAKSIGYDVIVYTGIFNSQAELQQDYFTNCLENIYSLICKSRLDGIIFAAERFHNVQLVNRIFDYLSQTDVPCLTLGYKYKNYPYICAEQYSSTYMITRHLIEVHDCRKLYCIAGVPEHEPSLIVLTSLHCNEQIFGYCATAYDSSDAVDIGDYYMRWCDAVSNGLYILQKNLYIDYIHQQTELLSTTDSATGFLNKRGFIEKLPDTLHRLRKEKKNYAIMLISWVKNNDDRAHDLVAAFAHSLLSVSNVVIRVRLSEKCFALLLSSELPKEIPDAAQAAVSTLENVLSGLFIGTSVHPELITELSEISVRKPAEIERFINEFANDFFQKCNAAESSYTTTKQLMYKLRRDIMSQPQLEWCDAAISEQLNISITHLRRMYKNLFSVNIKDDVINSRIERAKQLLLHTDLQIQEIAFRCGYQNGNHFMRQFKAHTGKTAREFRTSDILPHL